MPRGKDASPEPPELRYSREEVEAKLAARVREGNEIIAMAERVGNKADLQSVKARIIAWNDYNGDLLQRMFTTDDLYNEYQATALFLWVEEQPVRGKAAQAVEFLRGKAGKLESIAGRLNLYHEATSAAAASATATEDGGPPRKVFIIHGHDRSAALELKELINDKFDALTAVLLDREAHAGRTLIEKFEQVADDCGFAFAVFSPDDFVATDKEEYYQMRPNVVFELGWFYGKLGRKHTCVLYKEGTAVPTDLLGIGWHKFTDSVRDRFLEIEIELKAAYEDLLN